MKTFSQLVEEMKGSYVGVRYSEQSLKMLKDLQKMYQVPNPTPVKDMHTTVAFSRNKIDFPIEKKISQFVSREVSFHVFKTGSGKRALVLKIKSDYLKSRHELANELGATYDFPDYIPHITLSYDIEERNFTKKSFKLESDLEIVSEYGEVLDLNWKPKG